MSYQHFNLRTNLPVSIVSPNITGLMSKDDFTKLASPYLPESNLDEFTDNTFKLFDEVTAIIITIVNKYVGKDRDGLLDFGEFALAVLAIETKNSRERLVWTFDRIFDQVRFLKFSHLRQNVYSYSFIIQESSANIDARKGEEVIRD